jgi:hypothetical protein
VILSARTWIAADNKTGIIPQNSVHDHLSFSDKIFISIHFVYHNSDNFTLILSLKYISFASANIVSSGVITNSFFDDEK